MHKKFFTWGMQRWFLCLGLFGLISTLIIGGYSFNIVSESLFNEAKKTSLLQMKQANDKMNSLEEQIEEVVRKISKRNDLLDAVSPDANEAFDTFLRGISTDKYIGACFVRTSDGREFKYNPDKVYEDMVYLQMFCGNGVGVGEELRWINGDNENFLSRHNNYYIVCSNIRQTDDKSAGLYLFVKKEAVNEVLSGLAEKNNIVMIIDNGKMLAVNDKVRLDNITKITTNILMPIYEAEEGFYNFKKYDENYIISHYQMSGQKFKFLTIYETREFYKECYRILGIVILLVVLLSALMILFYLMIRKQYLIPFKTLVKKMKNVDYELGSEIEIEGNEEISILSGSYNEMIQKIGIMLEDIKKQEESKRKAEVSALRYQINPHFFYNTLSNIKMFAISKGQTEISETISKFANVYSYLFSNESNFVSVNDEMDFITNYVSLMNNRYNNQIDTLYMVDDVSKRCAIPIFLMQPIIENAIIHGLSRKLNANIRCLLRVNVTIENGMLCIRIYDDGVGLSREKIDLILSMRKSDKQLFGLGMYNTISRLNHQYGDNYGLEIDSKENEYTNVTITIPVREDDEQD